MILPSEHAPDQPAGTPAEMRAWAAAGRLPSVGGRTPLWQCAGRTQPRLVASIDNNQQLLDPLPIPVIFLLIAVLLFVTFEVGYHVGLWWQRRTPDDTEEGPTGTLIGSLLALLAFLLAVTMGMAADRFDTRRGLVIAEANAIDTTYLRAGYIPEPYGSESRELLRQYAPLRINTDDRVQLAANFQQSEEIQAQLWTGAEAVAEAHPGEDVYGLYIESLNEMIDLHATRVTALIYGRVPETIIILLIFGAALALAMVGYSGGLAGKRSALSAAVLIVVLSAVLTLVVDLDRPRNGFIQVSQQPIIDLISKLGPP